MRHQVIFVRVLFLLMLLCGAADFAVGQTKIHIYIRAFIPREHTGNPGYVRPVPAEPGLFVIPEPTFILPTIPPKCISTGGADCFLTDNRLFSDDVSASSRAGTEFVLVISGNNVTVEKADGRDIQRTGPTHKVICQTAADIVPPKSASTSSMHIGTPASAGGIVQIVVDGRANNPLVTPSPDIKYSGTFTFDTRTNTLRFQGSTGVFPAYEAYAQLNGGPIVPVFQNTPGPSTTVCDLIDLGTGLQLRSVDTTVTLRDNLSGRWETTDADKRFLLEVTGTSGTWTERGTVNTTPGATLVRTVSLAFSSGKFRIERANDMAALTFANFQPQSLRDAIIAKGPSPSFITLTRSGDTLSAEFNGLRVTKNPNGTLKDLIQPGDRPPTAFTFRRLP